MTLPAQRGTKFEIGFERICIVSSLNLKIVVKPTIFPDGGSETCFNKFWVASHRDVEGAVSNEKLLELILELNA